MKRILILSISAIICVLAFAQPMGMQQQSTYEQVDEEKNVQTTSDTIHVP